MEHQAGQEVKGASYMPEKGKSGFVQSKKWQYLYFGWNKVK